MGVSVIICCYNSSTRLRETLRHLALQETHGLKWEIVLVDNASADNTKNVAIRLWQEFERWDVKLKIVDQPIQGLSLARKKGIESAEYDVFIFCDDDNWLEKNYVAVTYRLMAGNDQIGAVGGTGTAVAEASLPYWFEQYKGCFACYPQGEQDGELNDTYSFLYGAGLAVRREVLQKLSDRKFVPILPDRTGRKLSSGGDTELSYAIRLVGYKLWFSKNLKFFHYLPAFRLTEQYLYRLVSSMSYCSGFLVIYHYVLTGKEADRFVWLKDALYQLFFFIRSLLLIPFGKSSTLEKKLNFAFSYNRMRSVFHQTGMYRSHYKNLKRLKE